MNSLFIERGIMDKLQKYLEKSFLNIHSPGYVIEIMQNDTILEFCYGNKCVLPKPEKIEKDVLYDIASLTKAFTAVLIYMAYEEGTLDIKQSVFSLNNNFINLKEVTILDLLCHNQEIYTDGYLGNASSLTEFNKILYSAYVKSNNPTYIDTDYIILSNILEKIYGIPFNELVTQKILEPLQLKDTTFRPKPKRCDSSNYEHLTNTIVRDLELGVVHDKKARCAEKLGIYVGHAGLFATGADILKFLKSFFDCSLLKKETIDLMLQHHDINAYNLNVLKSYLKKDLEINELYKLAKEKNPDFYLASTYNFMGCRYPNAILERNDVPLVLSKNSITFSGFTGPMFVMDFEKKIIILVMCNVLHNTNLDRAMRKHKTSEIINYILTDII